MSKLTVWQRPRAGEDSRTSRAPAVVNASSRREVAQDRAMSAAELAAALGGRRCGRAWMACCPAHPDRSPSLSIDESPDGRLLLHCFAGCSWDEIRRALDAKGLWTHGSSRPAAGAGSPRSREPRQAHSARCRLEYAEKIWRMAVPARGTPVETYIRSRAIAASIPATIRYARLRHRESGLYLPCMVAAVQADAGRLTGLHRTYLHPDGRAKADVDPVKKMIGECRGGAVRLTPAAARMALCEGIESGLSIAHACPGLAVWCALSAGNLDRLTLPAGVEEVVLVADGDAVGLIAACRAAQHYGAIGRRVRLVELPAGLDANDVLRAAA